jgi:hypothetical protein
MATQQDIDNGLKICSTALVEVNWLDACAHMNIEKINSNKLMDFLCPTQTIGKVVAQDENVFCVATNISQANGVDLIAIPIKWIKMIKIFEGK